MHIVFSNLSGQCIQQLSLESDLKQFFCQLVKLESPTSDSFFKLQELFHNSHIFKNKQNFLPLHQTDLCH